MRTKYEYTRMHRPVSTAVQEIRYNDHLYLLYVKTHYGDWYGYGGVSPSTFDDFIKAESAGFFWNKRIRAAHYHTFSVDNYHEWVLTDYSDQSDTGNTDEQSSGDDYAMTLDYTGELTFTVNADSIVDAVSELDRLLKSLGVTGNYSVKEVKKV